jgi:hypothetical protein
MIGADPAAKDEPMPILYRVPERSIHPLGMKFAYKAGEWSRAPDHSHHYPQPGNATLPVRSANLSASM